MREDWWISTDAEGTPGKSRDINEWTNTESENKEGSADPDRCFLIQATFGSFLNPKSDEIKDKKFLSKEILETWVATWYKSLKFRKDSC